MSRLDAIDPLTATGKAKALLDAVHRKLGLIPMMTRVMAASPVVLESYPGMSGALAAVTSTRGRPNRLRSPSRRTIAATTASRPTPRSPRWWI